MPLFNLNNGMAPAAPPQSATPTQPGWDWANMAAGGVNANVAVTTAAGIDASVQLTGIMVALLLGAVVLASMKWPVL